MFISFWPKKNEPQHDNSQKRNTDFTAKILQKFVCLRSTKSFNRETREDWWSPAVYRVEWKSNNRAERVWWKAREVTWTMRKSIDTSRLTISARSRQSRWSSSSSIDRQSKETATRNRGNESKIINLLELTENLYIRNIYRVSWNGNKI